ncbi:hypothetical protein AVEN_66650-1 [Araneus ventricosus]|uniref:Gustatory receptor n=1 Tax=Araneus ventricosus TaxID=182803 RepID=A0A4Y2PHI2_ARAVE|nr:hypothetical protein AVEN_66650-1 [Araneus ventricosus]
MCRRRSSYTFKDDDLSVKYGTTTLCFNRHIIIILRLFSIFGIDITVSTKVSRSKLSKMAKVLHRWVISILMCYCLAARLYKASRPNVPLMLSFSESVATASSVVIRFSILFNKFSIVKIIRSLMKTPLESTRTPHSSYIKMERFFFGFVLGGIALTFCLSMTKALSELKSTKGFQTYKNAYLFTANASNQTFGSTIVVAFVWTSHLLYIANLYGVPGLALLLCCTVCQTVTFLLLDFSNRVKESCHADEIQQNFTRNAIFYLRKMRFLVRGTESALSPILFFLYSYLLCSLFYLVSLTIRGKLRLDDVKITYIGASFATLVIFYLLLSIKVARVHESVNQMHDAILQTSGKTLSSADMTALLTSAREFTRNTNITGWGVFVIDRSFLLTSVGMIISYGVILAQFG